jgi:hypothetical protein
VATSTGDAQDQYNRAVFEEVYRILKLCWADEAFAYTYCISRHNFFGGKQLWLL